jgi:hypothetical protein
MSRQLCLSRCRSINQRCPCRFPSVRDPKRRQPKNNNVTFIPLPTLAPIPRIITSSPPPRPALFRRHHPTMAFRNTESPIPSLNGEASRSPLLPGSSGYPSRSTSHRPLWCRPRRGEGVPLPRRGPLLGHRHRREAWAGWRRDWGIRKWGHVARRQPAAAARAVLRRPDPACKAPPPPPAASVGDGAVGLSVERAAVDRSPRQRHHPGRSAAAASSGGACNPSLRVCGPRQHL